MSAILYTKFNVIVSNTILLHVHNPKAFPCQLNWEHLTLVNLAYATHLNLIII